MTGLAENISRAARLTLPARCIVDGRHVDAADGATLATLSPRDGTVLGHVPAGSARDIDGAVAAARAAFDDGRWRGLAPREKKRILFRLAELMERERDELALLESLDTGKPIGDARAVDVPLAIQTVRWYAEALDKVYGEVGPTDGRRLSLAVREPLGVIGAIVPWNFPLHMAMWKVAPALAAGNAVVLKPAEQSPLTALRVGALALEAGLPAGVLNVVTGLGATAGEALARHMDVDMIAFTGSGRVGRRLMVAAGESNLKRVSLELGGKSPQIVFDDCPDLDAAADAAAWGVFFNQGQVCTAASRLLVQEGIRERFIEKVAAVARDIAVGDPLDPATRFGAMIGEAQLAAAIGHVERAGADGGRILLGGERVRPESGGFYLAPTIVDRVDSASALAREEVFGPVLGIMSFADTADAVRIANDTVYGLASGLWTASLDRALSVSRALRAGLVWVNGWDSCDIAMPFGGFKQSGFGRDRSLHALEKYTDLKAITFTVQEGFQ